jgi:hypothetical protein
MEWLQEWAGGDFPFSKKDKKHHKGTKDTKKKKRR